MNWLDITLLCLAGIGFGKGLFDGFIKQVVSLIALVAAIFLCGEAAGWLRGYIVALGWFPEQGVSVLSYVAGFILIMGVLVLAGEIVTKVIHPFEHHQPSGRRCIRIALGALVYQPFVEFAGFSGSERCVYLSRDEGGISLLRTHSTDCPNNLSA